MTQTTALTTLTSVWSQQLVAVRSPEGSVVIQ